jgi:glutamyl-tRNA reductase
VSELVAPDDSGSSRSASGSGSGFSADSDATTVESRIRDRAERVRRREVETALDRLATGDGKVTPAERRIVTELSASLTDALVESWTANLDGEAVDPEMALELLTDGG